MTASAASALRNNECLLVTGGAGFIGSSFIRFMFRQPEFSGRIVNYDLLTYAGNLDNVAGAVDEKRYRFVRAEIYPGERIEQIEVHHARVEVRRHAGDKPQIVHGGTEEKEGAEPNPHVVLGVA
jgi:UDP-glucose 4-epimerase